MKLRTPGQLDESAPGGVENDDLIIMGEGCGGRRSSPLAHAEGSSRRVRLKFYVGRAGKENVPRRISNFLLELL